jgi:hypothetical protein
VIGTAKRAALQLSPDEYMTGSSAGKLITAKCHAATATQRLLVGAGWRPAAPPPAGQLQPRSSAAADGVSCFLLNGGPGAAVVGAAIQLTLNGASTGAFASSSSAPRLRLHRQR